MKTKRLISLLMTLALCLSLLPLAAVPAGALSGEGTETNPYLIGTAEDLAKFRDIVNGANGETQNKAAWAVLTDDINLNDDPWTPIGAETRYNGGFDGRGHTVFGLKVSGGDFAGLFGQVGRDGTVRDLGVAGGSVSNSTSAAGVVGYNGGRVENCYNAVTITGKEFTGGVVGDNSGTVKNCYNTGTVSDGSVVGTGGVVGENGGKVENCYNTGKVTGSERATGGIAGSNVAAGTVTGCFYCAGTANRGVGGIDADTAAVLSAEEFKNPDCFPGWFTGDSPAWYMGKDAPQLWAFPTAVSTWSELYDALQTGGPVKLTADVKFGEGGGAHASEALTIPTGKTATLDLNGHIVDRGLSDQAPQDDGNVITVSGTLTVTDSVPDAAHTDGYDSLPDGGVITGGNNTGDGGGVYVNAGSAEGKSRFTMLGGTITGNTATNGGGVYVNASNRDGKGTFTLKDGVITGNRAVKTAGGEGGRGGGVYVEHDRGVGAELDMRDTTASITGNTAQAQYGGGGIYVHFGGGDAGTSPQVLLSGHPVIEDNSYEDPAVTTNNVYLHGLEEIQNKITVAGELDHGASVGVSMFLRGVFTKDWSQWMGGVNPGDCFFSDKAKYAVALTDGGEVQLTKAIQTEPVVNKVQTDGTAVQPLLKDGQAADGFTLYYALGENETTTPTADWKADIPAEKDADVYYVWVKAVSDSDPTVESTAFCIPAKIVFLVTFQVENGQWNDGTTGDKFVSLTRDENEDLALVLAENDIPAVGSEPASGCKSSGSWSSDNNAWDGKMPPDMTISQATSFTFTYAEQDKEPTPEAEFTATGPSSGTLSKVTAGMKYSTDGGSTWTDISSDADINLTGLSACTIQVVKKGDGVDTKDSDAQPIAVTKEAKPAAEFKATGPDSGTLSKVTADMKYSTDGGTNWTDITGTSADLTGLAPCTITVVKPGSAATALDSDAQSIAVTKADAPAEVGKTDCTAPDADDGTLTGVNDTMEYQKDGDDTWTAITGETVTGLTTGTWLVRVKADGAVLASAPAELDILAKVAAPELPEGGTFSGSKEITITCATEGAAIHYTTDGSEPDAGGTLYTEPFVITASATVKAIAVKDGMADSEVVSAAYTRQSSSHSGGGSSSPANAVSVSSAAHGKVTADPVNAKAGDTVVLTVTADQGWQATDIIVKDAKGNAISVTKNPDGTYSFVMPGTAVTVTPVFEEIKEPGPDDPDAPGKLDVSDTFIDVSRDAWYHDAVQWVVDKGLMNGVSDTLFAPEGTCTRAMVVTMLWRLAGEPVVNDIMPYTDVPEDTWYTEAVRWAASAGAVNGTSETTFDPNAPVTREQLAAILYRYAQAQGKGFTGSWMFLLDYPDADQVSDWANEAMHWMTMNGVITGMDDGTLAPKDNATRAQIATMFMRFCEELNQ